MRKLLVVGALLLPWVGVCQTTYDVALIRPTSLLAQRPSAGGDVSTYFQNLRNVLEVAGLRYHTVEETALAAKQVPVSEFVACPYNPDMPAEVEAALLRFLDDGGRALLCFFCPTGVRDRLGMGELLYTPAGEAQSFATLRATSYAPPGMPAEVGQGSWNAYLLSGLDVGKSRPVLDWVAGDGKTDSGPGMVMSDQVAWIGHVMTPGDLATKAQMLLSVFGSWRPEVWQRAAAFACRRELGYQFAADWDGLRKLAADKPVKREVEALVARFDRLAAPGADAKPWDVFREAVQLRSQAEDLYLASLPSRPDKLRGAWVVMPQGAGDWGWETTARVAKENGLTDLFVRVEWGGRASYHSKVIPSRLEGDEDPVAEGIAACHKYGLRYNAWFINNNWRTPTDEIIARGREKGWWQIGPDGSDRVLEGGDRTFWLNPSEPGVVQLQADMMAEFAANYPADGVHFDYIRYENYSGSYGPRDRERFETWAKVAAAKWPEDVLAGSGGKPDGPLFEKFAEWRCEQVSRVVQAVAEEVHRVRGAQNPVAISAAVYPSWPYHRTMVGQDWARWLREGWIDFVCPMAYDSPSGFERHTDRVKRQREAAGDKPLYVGIGAWLHAGPRTVAESVVADRKLGADGFLLFSYTTDLGDRFLPALRRGVFAGD